MNQREFELFYKGEVGPLFRFLLVRVSNRAVAEDLTSEAFSRLLKRIQEGNVQNPRAYLYQIARNCIADHFKAVRQTISIDEWSKQDEEQGDGLLRELEQSITAEFRRSQQYQVGQAEALADVREILGPLGSEERLLLSLRYAEQYDWAEIANRLGKSIIAVRVAHHRIVKKIRDRIGEV